MSGLVRIHIACNDPDSGLFAGRAEQVALDDGALELTCRSLRAPKFTDVVTAFWLSGKRWRYSGFKEWFGNWCWNAYVFDLPTAAAFFVWLHERHLFDVDQCPEGFGDRWSSCEPLAPEWMSDQLLAMGVVHTGPRA